MLRYGRLNSVGSKKLISGMEGEKLWRIGLPPSTSRVTKYIRGYHQLHELSPIVHLNRVINYVWGRP